MAIQDVLDLHICIAGAGMGGLASALTLARNGFRRIDVFESASSLGFVGAGIQLAPNMARILDRLGVWTELEREAVTITDTSIRQGSTDEELAKVDLSSVEALYGYPHMVGHRSSLASNLYEGCKREKAVRFFFSTAIGQVDMDAPRPAFMAIPRDAGAQPYAVNADILLAADGIKSTVREQMLELKGICAQVVDSGSAAYRIILRREDMAHDPELLALVDSNRVTRWIGEQRHIIAYPMSNNTLYNISTAQPDVNFANAPSATYTTKGSKAEMMRVYDDYCPLIHRLLDLAPEGEGGVYEWKLRVHDPLPSWVQGCTALIGDACHPTLPHMAQGAAQAIEDGAVVGIVLSRLAKLSDGSPEAINKALRVYEEVRMERAYTIVRLAAENGLEMHLGKGAAKEARDRQFAALKHTAKGPSPDKWADADIQKMVYGQDVMKIANECFNNIFSKL